jgi:non-specific serine/threonine protein kinase/serine/threonine-protein kinase
VIDGQGDRDMSSSESERCPRCGGKLSASPSGASFCPACLLRQGLPSEVDETVVSEPAPLPPDVKPPERIGPYRIVRRLGEGGMGVVYLAKQTGDLKRLVAVKVIKSGLDSAQVLARFQMERQSLALMNHPSIARALDAGTSEDGRPYFVMEFVDGLPITNYCDKRRLTNAARIELFRRVCQAVQHAHQRGVIHRDLKPSNILVEDADDGPRPRIIDFGVAKATEKRFLEWSVFTEVGSLIGTPEYMSPEQADDSESGVDTRSDVYSLGVLLYELLVGVTPLDARELRSIGLSALLKTVRQGSFPTPSSRAQTTGGDRPETAANRGTDPGSLARQLRGELDWIVMRALEKDKERRYATPAELGEDLRRYLEHEPVRAGPPGLWYRTVKLARRHRVAFGAAAVLLVALVVAVAGISVGFLRARRAEREAVAQAEIANATNQFLNEDLLASVAPEMMGRDVRVLDVLERADELIAERFEDAPLTRAAIHLSVGMVFVKLGDLESGERHYNEAAEIRREILGPDDAETAEVVCGLGWIRARRDEVEPSLALIREGLEGYRAAGAMDTPTGIECQRILGQILHLTDALEEAETTFLGALERSRAALGDRHEQTINALNDLSLLYGSMGDSERAETTIREAIELQTEVRGPNHAETLVMESNLANSLYGMGRPEEAAELYRSLLPRYQEVYGSDHPRTMTLANNLAVTLSQIGENEEAVVLLGEVLEWRAANFGERHRNTLSTRYSLGRTYYRLHDYPAAVEHLREAYDARREVLGEDNRRTLYAQSMLAAALNRQGETGEALRLHRDALDRRAVIEESHPEVLAAFFSRYGEALADAGRRDEAIAAHREAERLYALNPDKRQAEREQNAERLERLLNP